MLEILKIFVIALIIVLFFSSVCGIIAFFKDLRDFKSEKQLSLPRKKLIQALLEEEELKKEPANELQENEVKESEIKCSLM